MAETKTTIPVEIKMGNAGTNDANLPAFKEGSIIFTKDTKKIYIDPVGETERIEIGENKQDKFANITNPGICKVTMSNSGQTYFCNYASDSGIYFDSSIRLLQGKGIKNDDDLVNKKYVDNETAKKQDKITPSTDLVLNRVILGNANVILSGNYNPTTGGSGYMLKIGGDLISDPVRITNVDDGVAADNAVNKKQLDTKQDKFATVTTKNTVQAVKIGDDLSIVTSPNFGYSQISSTKILTLSGADSGSSYVSLRKTKLESNCDFDATQGYLRVRNDPLADDFAVNKKYVDDIKTELLNAITHPYTYDETTKELTLIL